MNAAVVILVLSLFQTFIALLPGAHRGQTETGVILWLWLMWAVMDFVIYLAFFGVVYLMNR